jgi:hypothetical protein
MNNAGEAIRGFGMPARKQPVPVLIVERYLIGARVTGLPMKKLIASHPWFQLHGSG